MPELSKIQKRVLEVFIELGAGKPISLNEIKTRIGIALHEQNDLPKRMREMKMLGWNIAYNAKTKTYSLSSVERSEVRVVDDRGISGTVRARILHIANSRCGMCGKHTTEDGIKLVIDHRVPHSWGGATAEENLWAICETCNTQKKNFFSTLDPVVMSKCMIYSETAKRIGELLKAYNGEVVPRSLLEIVGQDDEWTRRLRDLRTLGWKVEKVIDPTQEGRYQYAYKLVESRPWPASISASLKANNNVSKNTSKSSAKDKTRG